MDIIGSEIFVELDDDTIAVFDLKTNRHKKTLDRVFKKPLYEFAYAGDLLTKVIKSSGESIRLSYGGTGKELKVRFVGQDRLDYDSSGRLIAVYGPLGRYHEMTYYGSTDLLETFRDSKGAKNRFEYDDKGKLVKDYNALGGYISLDKTLRPKGFQVNYGQTGKIRNWIYVDNKLDGTILRKYINADESSKQMEIAPNGDVFTSYSDGTSETQTSTSTTVTNSSGSIIETTMTKTSEFTYPSGLKSE